MNVILLRYTPDPDRLVALAARRCYSNLPAFEIDQALGEPEVDRLLSFLRQRNHLSPFEHAEFTFSVDGISRALSHQLVRHRIASYSQESQRYVDYMKLRELSYIMPPKIAENPEALELFQQAMRHTIQAYREMLNRGIPPEDARYVFPNAVETKLVLSFNARSLFNFFEQRCCIKAQWEIRFLSLAMLAEVRKVAPHIFKTAGAPCGYDTNAHCREGNRQFCHGTGGNKIC